MNKCGTLPANEEEVEIWTERKGGVNYCEEADLIGLHACWEGWWEGEREEGKEGSEGGREERREGGFMINEDDREQSEVQYRLCMYM